MSIYKIFKYYYKSWLLIIQFLQFLNIHARCYQPHCSL
nr:MAG TPA: hypothetical protein [Caudoviricetes sp.]